MAKKITDEIQSTEKFETKKKPGRQPMSSEEKEAAAKVRAAEKEKAAHLTPEVLIQYQDAETDIAALVEAAKADFHQTKKRTLITAMTLYIKPEEHMAYYVINRNYEGKIPY